MNVLNLYILVIRICFGFRYSNFVLVLKNFEFTSQKNLRKNSYEIFSKLCKTNPIFARLSPKNDGKAKKQTQFKAKTKAI